MDADRLYRFGNLVVASELPLTLPGVTDRADWHVRLTPELASSDVFVPYHTWQDPSGRATVTFGRSGHDRLITFGGVARFRVEARSRLITCSALDDAGAETLTQLLTNEVLPLVAGVDQVVLHASAVIAAEGAIAFAGRSGAGKSTIAVRLAQRGCSLLTDDVVLIEDRREGPYVVPMEAPVRLWPNTLRAIGGRIRVAQNVSGWRNRGRKRVLSATEARISYARQPAPLRKLFLLSPDASSGTPIAELDPRDALAEVLRHSFVLATDEAEFAGQCFDRVSRLLRHVRVYRLPLTSDLRALDRSIESMALNSR
jgi:hypothetical protein